MPVSMDALAEDLAAETAALRALLAPLPPGGWRQATPAVGWTIGDQVSHLAYFDDIAVQSATDPDAFRAGLEQIVADGGINPDTIAERFAAMPGAELLAWFDGSRARLLSTFRALDPALRVPWFGPAMSAASSLTARIMETWAHGQDVADALGVTRKPTARLRHVARIGVRARDYAYFVRGIQPPGEPFRVELEGPDGEVTGYGPEGAGQRVTGPLLDFCLLVTQRAHRDDLALHAVGADADRWLDIAQAFAGPAGPGRPRKADR